MPPIKGNLDFSIHMAESLVNAEFDIATFYDRPLDHGICAPLPLLLPHEPDWPCAVLPIAVNVLQYPLPTARRCYRLGQAVRNAIESFPQDLKVVVVEPAACRTRFMASAPASTIRPGITNSWSCWKRTPEKLAGMTHADFVRLGGAESVEVIMWLAMRGTMPGPLRRLHKNLLPGHHHRHDGDAV